MSALADGLNRVGIDPMSRSMSPDIKPLPPVAEPSSVPQLRRNGRQITNECQAADVRENMFEPLDQAASGSVWVMAGGTERMLSLFGGVIGIACKRNGIAGAVTDNACRDVAAFEEAEFPGVRKNDGAVRPPASSRDLSLQTCRFSAAASKSIQATTSRLTLTASSSYRAKPGRPSAKPPE